MPKNISRALNYNEKKVEQKKAKCLHAQNFLKDAGQMNFYEKVSRFEKLNKLNERTKANTLHISLNFDPSEKLAQDKLVDIANSYMQKIGFGSQPYLVYEHKDAGHPHIHIVTTIIQDTGKRLPVHNLGLNESAKARKEIEVEFGLVQATKEKLLEQELQPLLAAKLHYGKAETKRGITNVLDHVLGKYAFTSLPELNAILKLYNVCTDRGNDGSKVHKHRGIYYRIINEKGDKLGVPIKASSIYSKPTLSNLEKLFEKNEAVKQKHKKDLKSTIDWIMNKPPKGIDAFRQALATERISLVLRQNERGLIYGMTYVDHNTRCVFNGSDLGKDYAAKRVLEKLQEPQQIDKSLKKEISRSNDIAAKGNTIEHPSQQREKDIADELFENREFTEQVPYELRKKRKKKIN